MDFTRYYFTSLPAGHIAAQKRQVCLRVCIDEQYFFLRLKHRKSAADMKGGRGFANAAFVGLLLTTLGIPRIYRKIRHKLELRADAMAKANEEDAGT